MKAARYGLLLVADSDSGLGNGNFIELDSELELEYCARGPPITPRNGLGSRVWIRAPEMMEDVLSHGLSFMTVTVTVLEGSPSPSHAPHRPPRRPRTGPVPPALVWNAIQNSPGTCLGIGYLRAGRQRHGAPTRTPTRRGPPATDSESVPRPRPNLQRARMDDADQLLSQPSSKPFGSSVCQVVSACFIISIGYGRIEKHVNLRTDPFHSLDIEPDRVYGYSC
jgi:hypothetical protein